MRRLRRFLAQAHVSGDYVVFTVEILPSVQGILEEKSVSDLGLELTHQLDSGGIDAEWAAAVHTTEYLGEVILTRCSDGTWQESCATGASTEQSEENNLPGWAVAIIVIAVVGGLGTVAMTLKAKSEKGYATAKHERDGEVMDDIVIADQGKHHRQYGPFSTFSSLFKLAGQAFFLICDYLIYFGAYLWMV